MSDLEPVRRGRAIWAPKRADDGRDTTGIGWVELRPGDPDYETWDRYLRAKERGQ